MMEKYQREADAQKNNVTLRLDGTIHRPVPKKKKRETIATTFRCLERCNDQ
jgi:hypothetical protein